MEGRRSLRPPSGLYLSAKPFLAVVLVAALLSGSVEGARHPRAEAHSSGLSTADLLRSIFNRRGSDKATRHNYHLYYADLLQKYKSTHNTFRMLEIGANTGASLLAWTDFFDDPAAIHAIAYANDEPLKKVVYSRDHKDLVCKQDPVKCKVVEVMTGDQSDRQFLRDTVVTHGAGFPNGQPPSSLSDPAWKTAGYDVIIDDGSHVPEHMVISFMALFPSLRPGGEYIIEDLETNYWTQKRDIYGYKLRGTGIAQPFYKNTGNAVEKFKQVADLLNRADWGCRELRDSFTVFGREIDWSIHKITFMNNMLSITKMTEHQARSRPMGPRACIVDAPAMNRLSAEWQAQNP